MKFSIAAALLSVISAACAQAPAAPAAPSAPAAPAGPAVGVASVIAPGYGAVWNAGKSWAITWNVNDASVANFDSIELRNGASSNLQLIAKIADAVPVASGKYDWNIPTDIATDSSYAVILRSAKGDSYSPQFTILGAPPGTKPSTNTTTGSTGNSNNNATGAQPSGGSPAASGSGSTSSPSTSSSASGDAAKESNKDSGAAGIKAGVMGVVGAVGVAALLL
ncbi:uncharacterized protein BYT42DRAFT_586896 [Radiomyces spectabilis]|uniref:uncharacterized protein n=1 Tax=Radiomyces spectabilis TaxID=64574 RepID=UPI00221F0F80|nr:uncharacterized protein BYT42DRAFT_586896 [Radiomyces spectabilis]KAI8367619.1 hypothetical protein BYT42DRAFT_586896 [Radiomyces spectabilis]